MTKRENLIRTITRDHPAWIPYRYDGSLTMLRPDIVVRPVEGGRDDWGVNWVSTNADEGSFPDGKPVITLQEIQTVQVPRTDFAQVRKDLEGRIARGKATDTLVICYNELTLFERAQLLLGSDEFLAATALDPGRTRQLLDRIVDYQALLTECEMSAGAEAVRFTDDWGTQSSLFISPAQWRSLIKPGLKRLYDIVKSRHGFVFQHSCGHIEEIVPDLIEIGVDVLDPCQPRSNDIFGWKARYGDRICFMGGLDTQGYLSFGEPEHVHEQVKQFASVMSRGGGYIAAPSHSITIPEKNSRAMIAALEEVNREQYEARQIDAE
jgi:uroporphyrinogen decarboxylase